jgi:hypothetical protein
MQFLKQSTAVDVVLGPFVDDTDGKTTEEALTLAQADLQLTKNGGSAAQKNDATSATHLYGGNYKVPLNTTDTNTLGCLTLMCKEAGALPVVAHFQVVTANWYDTMCSTDALDVNVSTITPNAITAAAINADALTAAKVADDVGEQFADQLLNRNLATGTDSGSATVRTVRQALRFLRNKWSISGTTLTVTKEDDTTSSWTSELTTSGAADPVTGSDPASA